MNKYKKIYFMGIKGVGMATLAIIAKQAGFIVAGSDVQDEFITDRILVNEGANVLTGFEEKNVEDFASGTSTDAILLISTAAHGGFLNPEVKRARKMGIKVITHGEAVGVFMKGEIFGRNDFEGISVSGSHGKTTITGMLSCVMTKLNLDPSFTAGTSEIFPIGAAGHYGKGKYFVAEADEYLAEAKFDRTPKFLYQKPSFLIINNIDFDHPDFYGNIEDVRNAYSKFLNNLAKEGVLIINGDDENIKEIKNQSASWRTEIKTITYGTGEDNEFVLKNFKQVGLGASFEVFRNDTSLGIFKLSIPGYHNAKNALAVIAFLIEIGVSVGQIQRILPEFKGVKRRLEHIGQTPDGVLVFDDYAHHPEEIRKTLSALKSAFEDKKVTVVFQGHTFSRTKALLSEFASALALADELILIPTFASMRRDVSGDEQDKIFFEEIRKIKANIMFIEGESDVVEYIRQNIKNSKNLVLTMGAGDVYKIAYKLTNQ